MSKTARQAERVSAADELVTAGPDGCGRCNTCAPNKIGGPIRMIVCPECGNKRCPHATDHRNACTGSNELGQPGSAYPAVPTLDEGRTKLGPWGAAGVVGRVLPTTRVKPNEINGLRAENGPAAEVARHGRSCRCGPDGCADSECPRRSSGEVA